MIDHGNTSFIATANRHYDRLHTPCDSICGHCEANPVRDLSEGVFATYTLGGYRHPLSGDLCLECAASVFEEELEEFAECLSLFANIFTDQHSHMPMAAE